MNTSVLAAGAGGMVGSAVGSAAGAALGWTHAAWLGMGAGLLPKAVSAGLGVLVGGAVAPFAVLGGLALWHAVGGGQGSLPTSKPQGGAIGDGKGQVSVNPQEAAAQAFYAV